MSGGADRPHDPTNWTVVSADDSAVIVAADCTCGDRACFWTTFVGRARWHRDHG